MKTCDCHIYLSTRNPDLEFIPSVNTIPGKMRVAICLFLVFCLYSTNGLMFGDSYIKECEKHGAYRMAALIEADRAEREMEKLGKYNTFMLLFEEILQNYIIKDCLHW